MTTLVDVELSNAIGATLLALAAAVATRFCRRPQVGYVLWLLVLAKLVMPPLVNVPWLDLSLGEATAPVSPSALADAPRDLCRAAEFAVCVEPRVAGEANGQVSAGRAPSPGERKAPSKIDTSPTGAYVEPTESWRFDAATRRRLVAGVCWTWLGGSMVWTAIAAVRVASFARLLRRARPAGAGLAGEVSVLAARIGLRRAPRVRLISRPLPPLVWGLFGRATLLIPDELVRSLGDAERRALLSHELVHLARGDHLVRWLELACLALYWWHPVAWWARRNLEYCEEACCDECVVALEPAAARAYAAALLTTIDFLSASQPPIPLGAHGFSQTYQLQRRLEMILAPRMVTRAGWPMRALLVALAIAVLPVSMNVLHAEPDAQGEAAPADQTAPSSAPATSAAPAASPIRPRSAVPATAPSIEVQMDRLGKLLEDLGGQLRTEGAFAPRGSAFLSAAGADKVPDDLAETQRLLAEAVKQARLKLALAETNYNRTLAAGRQAAAVRQAYEAETVTLDQLLESQRRLLESKLSYARTASDLCVDPIEREYLFEVARLTALNDARNEIRGIWKEVRIAPQVERADNDQQESQAREQYFQVKTECQKATPEFVRARAARDAAQQKANNQHPAPGSND